MPAMGFSLRRKSVVMEFKGYITPYVVITSILAATVGLIFGYDIGISATINLLVLIFGRILIRCGVGFANQVIIGVLLGVRFKQSEHLSRSTAIVIMVMVCTFVSAFSWSWGPLGWLIPSEIFPLETRSAGQSLTVCANFVFTFVIAQAFLSTLCHFKFWIFFFFAGWILIMTIFVFFFLPETKNVPIEEVTEKVWQQHWLWKKYVREIDLSDDEGGDS